MVPEYLRLFGTLQVKMQIYKNSYLILNYFIFSSGQNQIVYTDIEGQLGVMSDCINKEDSSKEKKEENETGETENDDVDFGEYQFEDDDEDNENAVSLEKLKKQYAEDAEPEIQSGNCLAYHFLKV